MASIRERTLKDGKRSYTAQIIRRNPEFFESRSGFTTYNAADKWAKNREKEIDAQIVSGDVPTRRSAQRATLGDAIDEYVATARQDIGKTKTQVLRTIREEYGISKKRCDAITEKDIVNFARALHDRPGLSSASTVQNYLSHLSAVFKHAPVLGHFPLKREAMQTAMITIKHHGLATKSEERERRPSLEELDALMGYFRTASAYDPRCIPMHIVTAFAIFSTRRQAEICRITWADYDEDAKRVMVRKMKNPETKGGRDTMVELPDPCCAIISALPRTDARIFPFNSDTISRRFPHCQTVNSVLTLPIWIGPAR